MTELSTTSIPGYVAGKWTIDPVHTEIGFTVRHMMISKVRGRFKEFSGEIVTGENPADSSVTADIKTASFTTDNEQRDGHIKSADFLEAETWPDMTYRSTGVRSDGGDFFVDGELTLKGVTQVQPPCAFSKHACCRHVGSVEHTIRHWMQAECSAGSAWHAVCDLQQVRTVLLCSITPLWRRSRKSTA